MWFFFCLWVICLFASKCPRFLEMCFGDGVWMTPASPVPFSCLRELSTASPIAGGNKKNLPKHRRSCVCQVTSLSLSQPLAEDQGCRWLMGSWSGKEHLRKPCLLTRTPDLLSSPCKTRGSRRAHRKALKTLQGLLTHSQERTMSSSHTSDLCYTCINTKLLAPEVLG